MAASVWHLTQRAYKIPRPGMCESNNSGMCRVMWLGTSIPCLCHVCHSNKGAGSCLKTGQHSIFATIKIKNTRMLDTITTHIDGFIE